jgi:alanine dehydrogenase
LIALSARFHDDFASTFGAIQRNLISFGAMEVACKEEHAMRIGIPKEIKVHECRVSATPAAVREMVAHGHAVAVQAGAGAGSGFSDDDYRGAGAGIAATAADVFEGADLIVKVKEPQPDECRMLREDQVLFTYLHLAADPLQAELLCQSGCTAIAYETVTDDAGTLPLLAPMSEIAGRMSVQVGAASLENTHGGRGMLLGGVPGALPARVVVIGGGVVGYNAASMAVGLGADVTVLDKSVDRLRRLDEMFRGRLKTCYATLGTTEELVNEADLVIGAVLIPGAAAPKLVRRGQLARMKPGAVLVDVAIDQGGCFETSRATTHDDPTYIVDGIVHYCVANMPGAVARTSTAALGNATLPFVLAIADKGWEQAAADDMHLRNGVNVQGGRIVHDAVAEALHASARQAA